MIFLPFLLFFFALRFAIWFVQLCLMLFLGILALFGLSYQALPGAAQEVLGMGAAFVLWLLCLLLGASGLALLPWLMTTPGVSMDPLGYLVVTSITLIFVAAAIIPAVGVLRRLRHR